MPTIKTTCEQRGICCNRCQEPVNIHACKGCNNFFRDGEAPYCEDNEKYMDNGHYHLLCYEKEEA